MVRYKVNLAYDGTGFSGSQRQSTERTVQGVVEAALRKLNWQENSLLLAGRTDSGVHASGQVAAFDLDWKHSTVDLRNALNAILPVDAAITEVTESSPDFHPRFDAVSRSYEYRIYSSEIRDPLLDRYTWQVKVPLDKGALQQAADSIVGTHDFSSLGSPVNPGGTTIRTVQEASWTFDRNYYSFSITANAFLYHMVRRLVFIQVEIGKKSKPVDQLAQYLEIPGGPPAQGLAPAKGLTLVKVEYP